MTDFLVHTGGEYSGAGLLDLLKQPYGPRAPEGRAFDFAWGSVAVLRENASRGTNILAGSDAMLAWIGDLVGATSDGWLEALMSRLGELQNAGDRTPVSLAADGMFERLNGAFAIVRADPAGFSIVTDPMSFTQVFAGKNVKNEVVAFGTHADLVAALTGTSEAMDPVSIAEHLLAGHCTYPHTMYRHVTELSPGSVHCRTRNGGGEPVLRCLPYWSPPPEQRDGYDAAALSLSLRQAFVSAVQDRCGHRTVAVALSGGLDSRLIMAAVTPERECLAFTLCDELNREARTAQKVAAAYGRPWLPLLRRKDYVADHLVDVARFVGFECEFVHAHLFGFADTIARRTDAIFTGDLSDTFLRAYTAKDFVCCKRWAGLRPDSYRKCPFEYARLPDFDSRLVRRDIVEAALERRRAFSEHNADPQRGSLSEWLKIYPFRQWREVAVWAAQRRVLPLKLAGADRRLLDFAFRCPIELKLGNQIFLRAAGGLYGPGLRIPSANDGVRPCSGHWWRLAQRVVRKSEDKAVDVLERLGRKPRIQHSWHDYPACWRESRRLEELREEYGANLDRLDGLLFHGRGRSLVGDKRLNWYPGFRLLHLAVWLGLTKEYAGLCRRPKPADVPSILSSAPGTSHVVEGVRDAQTPASAV
jgi:asparagine synthetase B (glutamine-hydrolysing)